MNKTLFKYIFKMQLKATVFVSIAIFFLILLFDFAEITRKYPISNLQETIFSIRLSLLRTPSTFCEILHYVYFITATFSLWNLCQSHQITILKSSGRSPQQILYPFLSFATFVSAIWLFIIHPIGLFSETQYNKSVNSYFAAEINHDVWVDCSKNDLMIFIKTIHDNEIEGLYIFNTRNGTKIFAQTASIEKAIWHLKNVTTMDNEKINNSDTMEFPNGISVDLIKLLSKSPEKHDIYHLYKIYKIQKKDEVTLRSYELELHRLLSNCYSFLLFALIAAVICFPINRYKTKTNIAIKVISTAIFLKFANDMFKSLAHGEVIPVQFACWAVMLTATCVFIAILVWREA
ncbi:MAG: LptF/LptG family permease [Holosporaceae bacterium]|jgi:lipopolysaccharide export LptBFGC system permease protein LptF|nr:LptF/LptG family permease [Holosporaceae bacterium]